MPDNDLDGVARDASTILDVLRAFEQQGFTGQFAAREGGRVECLSCRRRSPAAEIELRQLRRLEGASDPDDMLALAALLCPLCGARGTLVLTYGPSAPDDDAAVLRGIEGSPPPEPETEERGPERS
jgi:hypothetical protein